MKLLYQTHSPYARKALVFAHEAGLADMLEVIHEETSPTQKNAEVFAQNPLGKVPVLIRDEGSAIFDSDVICAYLDTMALRSLYPAGGEERWAALRLQALAQGLCDAGIALRWERTRRPEPLRYEPLAQGYELKLVTAYDWLEAEADFSGDLHMGHIALATALDWLAFRGLPDFRTGRPRLASWFAQFVERPSMKTTPLHGETQD
jgi:glutathione S-transferase